MGRFFSARRFLAGLLIVLSARAMVRADPQQLKQDKAARMLLDSARRAYNDGKHEFAAGRFREFLRQHAGR